MTVIGTQISWTNSTWNLAIGCTKVSEGCAFCYAEELVNRTGTFGQRFDEVRLKLERLPHIRKFKAIAGDDGKLRPHMVFVNSMSDFWHEAIPDQAIAAILDTMEGYPGVVFQILTKRPIRARRVLVARYAGKGIPRHIWIGATVEDNRVGKRLDILRSIKERAGSATLFVSVEPIVGPTDKLDFTGIDWAITGGESGPKARVMQRDWLLDAVAGIQRAGAALWHKQSGKVESHPNIRQVPDRLQKPSERMRWLVENGWEFLPKEKGGATIDKRTYRQLPTVYEEISGSLKRPPLNLNIEIPEA